MIPSLNKIQTSSDINWLIPLSSDDQSLVPWSDALVDVVNELAQFLLASEKVKRSPEMVALAFWARKTNIVQIQQPMQLVDLGQRPANLQKVFHIAPANVDTVFFYSLILSVLSGNQNIVRISQRSGEVTRDLVQLLQDFIHAKPGILKHLVAIVEYSAELVKVTAELSHWCDLRVVWGGDNAINAISDILPHTPQISFPDRFSVALVQLSNKEDVSQAVDGLLTDILPFRQQACSSPKGLYWWKTSPALQRAFFQQLTEKVAVHPQQFSMSDQVEQIINAQRIMMSADTQAQGCESLGGIRVLPIGFSSPALYDLHHGFGLILSQELLTLDTLPFADKLQTVSVFGISEEDEQQLGLHQSTGCFKRLVRLGQSLVFEPVWDGVDLPYSFTLMKRLS